MPESAVEAGYAPVNGLEMYYEIHGRTPPSSGGGLGGEVPLVLIHGAFATAGMWGPFLTNLAENHRVIAVELQGHGHTADIDRPFGFAQFADDVAAMMQHLNVDRADVVGYSMGATTGLQLAIRHPERVRKLVAISGHYRSDGYYPEVLAGIAALTPDVFAGSPIESAYQAVAPRPEDFPRLVEKIKESGGKAFAWPDEDLQSIAAPTQIIIADSDAVRPEHAVAMFRLLGGGVPGDLTGLPASQLTIFPGTTHVTLVDRPELRPMIEAFLAAPMPDDG